MAITVEVMKKWIIALNFVPADGEVGVYQKTYPQHDGYTVRVDLSNKNIEYADGSVDLSARITLGSKSTSNFANQENLVVLECVDRLLEKGYPPNSIELEKVYPSGRGHSGELDILVKDADEEAFLMVECKTWGKEYTKEVEKMLASGGQLFTYFKNATFAKSLCLYTSRLTDSKIEYENNIVDVSEDWKSLSETKDIHEHWNKIFKKNGIFEEYASPYNIVHKRLTYGDLAIMKDEDSRKIFHQIMTILRHNGVSDKPNAFNKLLNLFVCKIIDEDRNDHDELQFQCWEDLSDEDLQMTLNDLYKYGMKRFLEIDVIDHSQKEVDDVLRELGGDVAHKQKLMEMFSDTRLKKSPNFAFIEVQDEKTFQLNAKIVREIVELLQHYKFRYEQKHEFLGDFFEKMLNTSMKQEAGQYFTPVPITRFIISSMPLHNFVQDKIDNKDPDPLPTIIDYACGSGHFLTEYMSTMQNIVENVDISNAPPRTRGKLASWRGDVKFQWADEYVYGIDFDNRLVKTAKVSAFFNGDGEATIIWGDGLDSFEYSEVYRGKLKETMSNKQDNGQFDILISNPPYSVEAFRRMLRYGATSFDLYSSLTDNSKEIECLFVERMKQLLKIGGWAGVILPSSILSNEGIHSRAREIIFKYFNVKAVVELSSGTFMETGTNTVVLFLERRSDSDHEKIMQAINTFFTNKRDVTVLGKERVFSTYVASVYDDLSYEDYMSFVSEDPTDAMAEHELYKDYVKEFGAAPYSKAFEVEKEKMLYFILTHNQNIVVVKSGQKQDEKAFLGYEFSKRRGNEGIKLLPGGTLLFDDDDSLCADKVNSYISNNFLGNPPTSVSESVRNHVFYGWMNNFFEYGTSKFDKRVNLKKQKKIVSEKFGNKRIGDIALMVKRGKSAKYGTSHIQIIKSGQARGYFEFDFTEKHFVDDDFISDERNLIKGDILINSTGVGTAGRVTLFDLDGSFVVDSHITIVRADREKTEPKYILYALASIGFKNIEEMATGQSGQVELSLDIIEAISIPLPPVSIQKQIVAEFEDVSMEIESIRKNIEETQKSIKVKFLETFDGNLESSEQLLGNVCELKAGKFIPAAEIIDTHNEGFYPCYGGNGLRGFVDKYSHEGEYPLIGRQGALCGNVHFAQGKFYATEHAVVARPKIQLNACWLYFALQELNLNRLASGAAQPGLTVAKLNNVKIQLPPIDQQNSFAEFFYSATESISKFQKMLDDANKNQSKILEKYL